MKERWIERWDGMGGREEKGGFVHWRTEGGMGLDIGQTKEMQGKARAEVTAVEQNNRGREEPTTGPFEAGQVLSQLFPFHGDTN